MVVFLFLSLQIMNLNGKKTLSLLHKSYFYISLTCQDFSLIFAWTNLITIMSPRYSLGFWMLELI